MSKKLLACSSVLLALLALAVFGASTKPFSPGQRSLFLAHNSYPEKGQWADRLDRALGTGTPLGVEVDLCWIPNPKTGKNASLIAGNEKGITGNEPTLKSYLFEHVRPIVEKALKENDKKNWPLIMVYLDIKNDPPEHLESIWGQLGEYENWLTTAVKTKNAAQQSPLDLKPMMMFVDDTRPTPNIKEEYFYNRLPIGAKLRVFGSAKLTPPPGNLNKAQVFEAQAKMKLEDLIKEPASNYHRWWAQTHWDLMVEQSRMKDAGQWTPEKEARLKALVNYAHKMGYFVGVWCLDGFEPGKGLGWGEGNNLGSLQAVTIRWKAAVKAGTDFVTSDQYEEAAKVIKGAGVN